MVPLWNKYMTYITINLNLLYQCYIITFSFYSSENGVKYVARINAMECKNVYNYIFLFVFSCDSYDIIDILSKALE